MMMEKLNLEKCKTNKEVCALVSERVDSIPYSKLLEEVDKRFIYQTEATRSIYTGLSENISVFLSGPGGYGKSSLIKFILNFYGIPFNVVVGYKDMPVDALLGIPNMDKLLKDSKYEINFEDSPFYKPGILIGEEFTDILPSTAAALKDILSEKGYHTKEGKTESLIACMIVAANKSAKEVIDDESKRAFYDERFPIQREVIWKSHTANDYMKLLKLHFPTAEDVLLFFMARLFESNHVNYGNTISPRIAYDITKTYLNKGIVFISDFNINTDNINEIKTLADREYNTKSSTKILEEVTILVQSVSNSKEHKLIALHTLKGLSELVITDEILAVVLSTKKGIEDQLHSKNYYDTNTRAVDKLLNLLSND